MAETCTRTFGPTQGTSDQPWCYAQVPAAERQHAAPRRVRYIGEPEQAPCRIAASCADVVTGTRRRTVARWASAATRCGARPGRLRRSRPCATACGPRSTRRSAGWQPTAASARPRCSRAGCAAAAAARRRPGRGTFLEASEPEHCCCSSSSSSSLLSTFPTWQVHIRPRGGGRTGRRPPRHPRVAAAAAARRRARPEQAAR